MPLSDAYRVALALLHAANGWLPVTGNSMAPLLLPGDQVQVAPVPTIWRPGQILVFTQATHLTTHRLLHHFPHSLPPQCQTQGDNTWHPDPPWPTAACVGRVIAVKRNQRILKLDTKTWHTLGALLALALRAAHHAQGLQPAPLRFLAYWPARALWRALRRLCQWSA